MSGTHEENFLRLIKKSGRGKLKIYIGYAPGTGRTRKMLEEAAHLKINGIDVAAGFINTHEREDLKKLLDGIEVIPPVKNVYRGIESTEMNLQAILERRSALVLVDDMAHANLPGSRNSKRYMDVEALLSAGIHVISSLCISQIESYSKSIEELCKLKVKDFVPDKLIDEAEELSVIEISPQDLIERLKAGKLCDPERIPELLEKQFSLQTLEQLRKLASGLGQSGRRKNNRAGEKEHILLCLTMKSAENRAMLKYAAEIAEQSRSSLYAVHVQAPLESGRKLAPEEQAALEDSFNLAQQMGAAVLSYKGDDFVKSVLQCAREYNADRIILCKSICSQSIYSRIFMEKNLVERFLCESKGISVIICDPERS